MFYKIMIALLIFIAVVAYIGLGACAAALYEDTHYDDLLEKYGSPDKIKLNKWVMFFWPVYVVYVLIKKGIKKIQTWGYELSTEMEANDREIERQAEESKND